VPIYEYDCSECRRRVSLLILAPSTAPPPRCPRCGSQSLQRVMSRFTTVRSEEDRLESLADPRASVTSTKTTPGVSPAS